MPTWDGIKDFSKPEYKGPEIILQALLFILQRTDRVESKHKQITSTVLCMPRPKRYGISRVRGLTWKFANFIVAIWAKTLSFQYKPISKNKVFHRFLIYSLSLTSKTGSLDYFENKKIILP